MFSYFKFFVFFVVFYYFIHILYYFFKGYYIWGEGSALIFCFTFLNRSYETFFRVIFQDLFYAQPRLLLSFNLPGLLSNFLAWIVGDWASLI